MRVTGSDGVQLEVAVDGRQDGTPVLLLHGWPDDGRLWAEQVAALTAAGYHAIVPDLRGFGASDKPAGVAAYALRHTVVDVLAVLDAVDVPAVHVVAHDWGAAAGWGLAAFAGDRVRSYTALSVGHPAAFRAAGFEQRMRSWYMLLFNVEGVAEQWLEENGEQLLASHPHRDRILAGWGADPSTLTAGLGWYRANAHAGTLVGPPPQLPPVTCPVFGIWSTGDAALTERQMTASATHVAGEWRYERLEGVGHWMQAEAPERLNPLLLDWLAAQA